jgi:hypothetical protein
VLAFASAPGAAAPAKKRVAILDFVADGVSADVHAQFETTIEEQLRSAGYTVVTHAATAETIGKRDLQEGCSFGPCVSAIGKALDVERLLDVRIGAEGQSYSYVVSMIDTRGVPVAQVADACAVCTVAEAMNKVGVAVGALEGRPVPYGLDAAPVTRPSQPTRSKLVPALLVAAGAAMTGGGAALVATTDPKAPGWVTIGSGSTVLLTGLVMLITGD